MNTISKADANKKYDDLKKLLKNGDITQAAFKASAERIYKLYHGKANKAGRNAAPTKTKVKPAETKKGPTLKGSSSGKERFFAGGKGGQYDKDQNKEKAKRNFFAGAKGGKFDDGTSRRNQAGFGNFPGQPKSKSKSKKPSRKDFPAGRSGATAYAAALRKYKR